MTAKSDWEGRTGRSWAAEWRRTDRAFGALTERLLSQAHAAPFAHALDIGCGAGELAMALARGARRASVLGVDVSEPLVDAARNRARALSNVAFEIEDAQHWTPPAAPDLLVSRHGVMFFDDPVAAFSHLCSSAAPDARLVFSCFRSRSQCPFFTEIDDLLPGNGPVSSSGYAPGPFAFSDKRFVGTLLEKAGWAEFEFEPFNFAMIAGAGPDPVEDTLAYFRRIGPAASVMKDASEAERQRIERGIADFAARHLRDGIVSARAAAWIVSARKAA